MRFRRLACLAAVVLSPIVLTIVSILPQTLLVVPAEAQVAPGQGTGTCSQADIDRLPTPSPMNGAHRVVQLVNCSGQVLLGAANAAHQKNKMGLPVFPREGTWVMQPYGTTDSQGNPLYVLTIDIPPQWERTYCPRNKPKDKCPALGPNFWARTGCRYDIASNRAQCETGGCAGQYDCSSGAWGAPIFTTITEWTFYQPTPANGTTYYVDNPDISLVNGASLNVDMEPVGADDAMCPAGPFQGQPLCSPISATDQGWLKYNYPLTVHGKDLRANDKTSNQSCTDVNGNSFLLKRSDIDRSGKFGYVIEDANHNPVMPPGDNPLACFSNCGKYQYPVTPPFGCDATMDPDCYAWNTYCAPTGAPYNGSCKSDSDCVKNNGGLDVHAACYYNTPDMQEEGVCSLRGFFANPTQKCPAGLYNFLNPPPGSPASQVACMYTYGSRNPLDTSPSTNRDFSGQPPTAPCSNITFPPGQPNGTAVPCIGDDTIHQVMHGAYTWPNDPQVYGGDSPLYRIIFSPGGTSVPITEAQDSTPLCSALPPNYNYSHNYQPGVNTPCLVPVEGEGAVYAVANDNPYDPNKNDWKWSCALDQKGSGNEGVLCRWHPAPATPSGCTPPHTDQYVTQSACGLIDGSTGTGITMVSNFFKPNLNDPVFLEVTIPQVLNPVHTPASITGCSASWTPVANGGVFINTDQGLIAWYSGISNNDGQSGAQCTVTVTLAEANPAAVKIYDVPSFIGYETTSTASGNYDGHLPEGTVYPTVFAESAPVSTTFANDLVLGGLLQVNQQLTPMTYWVQWLTNALAPTAPTNIDCQKNGVIDDLHQCPTDDGTEFLPSHGPKTSNSDVGHQCVTPGMHRLNRSTQPIPAFNWGGAAIYIKLNQACPTN